MCVSSFFQMLNSLITREVSNYMNMFFESILYLYYIEPTCTGGQVWKECGSACTHTCDTPEMMMCTMQCVRQCECPVGKVWHEEKCIDRSECPPKGILFGVFHVYYVFIFSFSQTISYNGDYVR